MYVCLGSLRHSHCEQSFSECTVLYTSTVASGSCSWYICTAAPSLSLHQCLLVNICSMFVISPLVKPVIDCHTLIALWGIIDTVITNGIGHYYYFLLKGND